MKTPFYYGFMMILCTFTCTTLQVNAQKFSADVSEEVPFSPNGKVFKYGTYGISMEISNPPMHNSFKFKLRKYKYHYKLAFQDKQSKLVKEVALSKGERVYGPFTSSLRRINDKVYFFYFNMEAEEDDGPVKLMAAEIDTIAYDLLPPKEIIAFDFKQSNNRFTFGNIGSYEELIVTQSPNKGQTLVAFSSGSNHLYFYSVLDEGLNQLWSRTGKIESVESIRLQSACIDNKENVYLGFKGWQKDELEEGHVVISKRKGNDKDVVVSIPEGKAYQVNLIASAKEDMVKLVGTYKAGSINLYGAYAGTIKPGEQRISAIQLTPFSQEFLKELEHDDWSSLKSKYLGVCACIEMEAFEHANGEVDMVGMFRRTIYGQKGSYIVVGDIAVAHFNKGKATFGRIPKYRVSAGSTIGDGYKVVLDKDQAFVLYNDSESNLARDISKDATGSSVYSNVVLVAATLSGGKIVERQKVIDLKKESGMAVPSWIDTPGDGTMQVPVLKVKAFGGIAKTSKMARITIN
jgi:hypothetical protein